MQYNKPTLVIHGAALACVQASEKPEPDMFDLDCLQTQTAYQADE